MKKIVTYCTLALLLVACHKDWTCTCVYPNSTTSVPYKDISESKAEDQCHASALVDSVTYNCSIAKR